MRQLVWVWVTTVACVGRDASVPDTLRGAAPSPGRDAFFDAFDRGDYAALDGILAELTDEAATDDVSQAVLGFAHAWRLAEYRRDDDLEDVTEHAGLAVDAFDAAVDRLPSDPRLVGFRGSFRLAYGTIEDQNRTIRKGWFDTVESSKRWPEWGLFTQAYNLMGLDLDNKRFEQGIEFLWENLDECANESVPRTDLDWTEYADTVAASDAFDMRACTNSAAAAYNVQGFFFVFGDYLAKAGQLDDAAMMYNNALRTDPGTWPYSALARDRLARLDQLPDVFAQEYDDDEVVPLEDTLVSSSAANCSICHQAE